MTDQPDSSRSKVSKTEEDWRSRLTPDQYAVTREKATEPPFSGEYHDSSEPGVYVCVCCGEELFTSEAKFDSGCGWPSFFEPASEDNVDSETDTSHGMLRTEVLCAKCDAHLGHIFPDGPAPTGQRYCINSLSLRLEPSD